MNSELPPRFAPLPVRLRPCLGESANSYIRRLARANHLKPSFLHCYLSGPPQWFAKPLLENLATVAGHSPEALERALAAATALGGTNRRRQRLPRMNPFAWRQSLADRIAREAARGTQIRALAQRYNLRCGDVRFALEIPRLTTTETGPLTDPVTGELADLIESMISRELNGRQIWTELMDHHDFSVTYYSIRHYIRYARPWRGATGADSST
ncbi:TniQ family protein [Streptomyces huasconensis]|uniref:TniQ family protein n=1 Tax=Streptomyces huasconensis TaxID=1854574 RepID=UPI0036FBC458